MKKILFLSIVAVIVVLFFGACSNAGKATQCIAVSGDDLLTEYGDLNIENIIENRLIIGYENMEAVYDFLDIFDGTVLTEVNELRAVVIETSKNVPELLKKMKGFKFEGIRYIEPSFKRTQIKSIVEDEPVISRNTGKDEYEDYQWGNRIIQSSYAPENGITGKNVVVAIFDSGCDGAHPDLSGQFVTGYDPLGDSLIAAGESVSYDTHGTHVAGIIAARANNGIGVAGVAPDARLMPIPIFQPWHPLYPATDLYIGDAFVAKGIIWAVNNGAKVLQHSWGGPGYSQILKDAFDYAISNGAVPVVSAGNHHIDCNWKMPGKYPGVIAAGASNVRDELAYFSTRGDFVSVIAPGERILSTIALNAVAEDGIYGEKPYGYLSGTSMAAPFVSGLAALLFEKYPNANAYQIRKVIEQSADIVKGYDGYSRDTGYGRINVKKALEIPLPGENGAYFIVNVTDSSGKTPLEGVAVGLRHENKRNYFANTNGEGEACFFSIDEGEYDIYVGGPDHLNPNSITHGEYEETDKTIYGYHVSGSSLLNVKLSSSFDATLRMPSKEGQYRVRLINSDDTEVFQEKYAIEDQLVTLEKPSDTKGYVRYMISVDSTSDPEQFAPVISENFESGDFNSPEWDWKMDLGGVVGMPPDPETFPLVQSNVVSSGNYAAQFHAPQMSNSSFGSTVTLAEGKEYMLYFDVRVSSYEDTCSVWDSDRFQLKVDGSFFRSFSPLTFYAMECGVKNWKTFAVPLSGGQHVLEFFFFRFSGEDVGENTAWIDNIRIIPIDDVDVEAKIVINDEVLNFSSNIAESRFIDNVVGNDEYFCVF